MPVNTPGPHTLYPGHFFRPLLVRFSDQIALIGSGCGHNPFIFKAGNHIVKFSATEIIQNSWVEHLCAHTHDNGCNINLDFLFTVIRDNGSGFTDSLERFNIIYLSISME